MGSSMQTVVLAGRLGQDPELKVTSGGVPMCKFSVAVDRPYRSQSGEQVTDWFAVRCWRAVAEAAARFLKKGSFVILQGRFESYTEDLLLDGGEVRRIKTWALVADTVTFGPKTVADPVVAAQDEPEIEPPPPAKKPVATKKPAVTKKRATPVRKAVRSE